MPKVVERIWHGGGYGTRKDRRPFRYEAFIPDPIAELDPELPGAATEQIARAQAAVVSLNLSRVATDLESLAGPLLRAEAVGSSFIEGYRISNRRLALASYEPAIADGTANTVLGNVKAMEQAIALGESQDRLEVGSILAIHKTLLEETPEDRLAGKLRREQNWIGGRAASPHGAAFIPPPEDRVPSLMKDLARFCNRDDLPVVVQAAIAHAQFETIHPFADGNGRTGRCLIHVLLRRRGLTTHYSPPVSVVLATNARSYIAGLTDYREGRLADWCGSFARSVEIATHAAENLSRQIQTLLGALLDEAGDPRKDSTARRIVESLPRHPILSAETVAETLDVTTTSARRALNSLSISGALSLTRVGRRRNREWACDLLFDLLDAFEFDLALPVDGTAARQPAPTRHQRHAT